MKLGFYFGLAKDGIRKNGKIYIPYILTCIGMVMMYYIIMALHMDETMIALSISAATNPDARLALEQIPKLKGCQAHTSVMLSSVDILSFRKLGIELTCEPKFEQGKKLQ